MPRAGRALIDDSHPLEREDGNENEDHKQPRVIRFQSHGSTAMAAWPQPFLKILFPVVVRPAAIDSARHSLSKLSRPQRSRRTKTGKRKACASNAVGRRCVREKAL